jgi:hypothetical protein
LFTDRFKRPEASGGRAPSAASTLGGAGPLARPRRSNALEQFFTQIRGLEGLNLLDLSGASQANIAFITSLGHRLYSEDLLTSLDLSFGEPDSYDSQLDTDRQRIFLAQNLDFPPNNFDGVLLWDTLEFLVPPLRRTVVEKLFEVTKPGAYLLALFHAETRPEAIELQHYRIADAGTLLLAPRGARKPYELFSNRAVEKLFQNFANVKFFLSRDSLREVIVKR